MKNILVVLLAAMFAISSVPASYAGTRVESCVVKKCLLKSRCDYKAFCRVAKQEKKPVKKGFIFLAPVIATIPPVTVVVGAAIIGVVSGAASTVGNRVVNIWWPNKPAK